MFKNYLKIAVRNLLKHKAYSLINISGLAIGIACCVLILLFVQAELSFDTFHQKKDRIYRINKIVTLEGQSTEDHAVTPGNMAPALVQDYPEVVSAVRVRPWFGEMLVGRGDERLKVDHVVFVDSTFFEIFDFELIHGDEKTVLTAPLSTVITEEIAQRFFGNEDPVGQTLVGVYDMPLTVTGIARKAPSNSHLQFDMLVSWSTTTSSVYADKFDWFNRWITQAILTYVLLAKGVQPDVMEAKFPQFMEKYMTRWADQYYPYLQSLTDIHLRSSHIRYGVNWNQGSITYVYVFSAIAFLILLIACINFMNLATARAAMRAREVGMRKVLGAYRRQLIKQFLGESVLFSLMAMVAAVCLVELVLPVFNDFTGKGIDLLDNSLNLWSMLGITLFVGIVSGSYPAFVLSSLKPVSVLKGSLKGGMKGVLARKSLVVIQFAVSIILIVGTVVVYNQMRYMQTKDMGFKKEQVVVLPINHTGIQQKFQTFKNELLKYPNILDVTVSDLGPGKESMSFGLLPEGSPEDERRAVPMLAVDYNFIETYGMEIMDGRDFSRNFTTDESSVIINEILAKQLRWDSPIGKRVFIGTDNPAQVTIIGIVKDFHTRSLHSEIEPFLLYPTSDRFWNLAVRISPNNISATIGFLRDKWKTFETKYPFEYSFLDDNFAQFYQGEQRLMQVLSTFSLLAIFIACLGLFGLASFTAEQRTKEIGIRKVLGATAPGIVKLLSKEFVRLVFVANVIGWPIAYFAMNKWLQNFAYRIDVSLSTFIYAGIAILVISIITVSFQAIKAALTNPVDALRYE